MLKKAIFDMDGLIFDSERAFMRCLGEVMREYGYTLTDEIYIGTIGLSAKAADARMKGIYGADYPFDEISKRARSLMVQNAKNGLDVKRGIEHLLARLNEREIECCVASSSDTVYVKQYIKDAGLDKYFTDYTGGDRVSRSKPEPDIFLYALGTAAADEAVIFEDSENGVKAGLAAGIRVICIPDMKPLCAELTEKVYAVAADGFMAEALTEEM